MAVFSILHKIMKDSDCVQRTAAALNEESAVEKIQRRNFTPAYEQGSEKREVHCLETGRCYTRESISSKTDQGWNDSKLGLKKLDPRIQTDEGNI